MKILLVSVVAQDVQPVGRRTEQPEQRFGSDFAAGRHGVGAGVFTALAAANLPGVGQLGLPGKPPLRAVPAPTLALGPIPENVIEHSPVLLWLRAFTDSLSTYLFIYTYVQIIEV